MSEDDAVDCLRLSFFFASDISGTSAETSASAGRHLDDRALDEEDPMCTNVTSPASITFAFFNDL